ncbi:acyl carrier protein [Acidithiobacillus ferrooxidans]|uniref:Acyl carrier protein n=1 Tax=Acidithiobacillus ferrooxidans TaxID=920 RepID=A0A2W1KRE7_ACIFR|nr:acyl carrier protein [Acidithiobacillus ferrooxidans]MBU2815916.1 acyl carrier protein [Acidithiobacillus ferrooxidans]MCR1341738.1 acyl carrier protein [Acidithiobacillus ferrooxidans]PZD81777.1 acyl carrier protein [Acidithiobacillus ferrooxidans]QLK41925.1 acyl carrier protein [Acidithiobacillus ferrooxidans]QZT53891.1 acyl carrier protein [Acidithiobacillus ferrooxidans]
MGTETVANRVKRVIVEVLGVHDYEVTDEAIFVDDFGTDSLDTVELVMALEEEFECDMPDNDVADIRTVGDVVNYFTSRMASFAS